MTKVTILADSIDPHGKRITTFELEYPRFIHAELLTHKDLARNSASSRAIPIVAMNQRVLDDPAMPIHWGINQSGMQAKAEMSDSVKQTAICLWKAAAKNAVLSASLLSEECNAHKQIANRLTEFAQWMKVVVTATEWNNIWWLRDHSDAQPEFQDLAHKMRTAYNTSIPQLLLPGEWHLPYVLTTFDVVGGAALYKDSNENNLTTEQAIRVSASCCAQVSYRKLDDSQEKADMIFDRLVNSVPVHASPTEHQATVIDYNGVNVFNPVTWAEGITHVTKEGILCSGNLRGWIQHRQLIKNNYVPG